MTTLRDLSRHLALSVTQVSRALNGHSDVSEDTRARVLQAARELRYQPNLSARKLVTGRSGMVGLVLPGPPASPQDTMFVQMVAGLSACFSRRERQFVLHIADGGDGIIDVYRRLIDGGGLDGFVLLSPAVNDPRVAFLRAREVPFVIHGRTDPRPDYPFFDIDNEAVGYRLTRLLTDRGHRRIAFVNGPGGQTFVEWRRDGYARALAGAGIAFDPDLHLYDEMTEGFGMIATLRLFDGPTLPPTGIVCGNSLIAKGVLQALAALRIAVPDQVSVVAHDDDLPGMRPAGFDPALTVTRSPLAISWQPLAELLLDHMDGRPVRDLQLWGDVVTIERASVAPPPA